MNTQPPEKPSNVTDSLEVVDVWDTVQGEGPYAGTPAVFVRLAGCNLQCSGCDTDYTAGRRRLSLAELLREVNRSRHSPSLVVFTGGEPFRQAALGDCVRMFAGSGYRSQVETNGTVAPSRFPYHLCSVVCSPKTPTVPYSLAERVDAWKYVVQAGAVCPRDGLPTRVLGDKCRVARPLLGHSAEVFVQPLDEQDEAKNRRNLETAVEVCRRHGYRLSLQLHKLIGLP